MEYIATHKVYAPTVSQMLRHRDKLLAYDLLEGDIGGQRQRTLNAKTQETHMFSVKQVQVKFLVF